MVRREYVVREDLRGTGELFRGDKALGRFRYRIVVQQERLITQAFGGAESVTDGLSRIEAHLQPPSDNPFSLISLVGEELRLHLEDGRWFECFLTDNDGTLANRDGRGLHT